MSSHYPIPVITHDYDDKGNLSPRTPTVPRVVEDSRRVLNELGVKPGEKVITRKGYDQPSDTLSRSRPSDKDVVGYWIDNVPVDRTLTIEDSSDKDVLVLKDSSGLIVRMPYRDLIRGLLYGTKDVSLGSNPGEITGKFKFSKSGTAVYLVPVNL